MEKIIISPTGQGMRSDAAGGGHYGASRGKRKHNGMDFLCEPGQKVYAPIDGVVVRRAAPYAKGPYGGLVIQGEKLAVKMFYISTKGHVKPGDLVWQGDMIGVAQDITKKYGNPAMQPHVHLEITSADPALFLGE